MDKNEYKLRADSIKELIQERRYKEAADIADTIEWKNVKNTMMLCTVSDLYKACRRYEDSIEVLELAYQKNPTGRMILYSLCELSIKIGDIVNAIEYFKEYAQVASQDTGKYVLRYKLYTAEGVGIEERIAVLEELQKRECKEKWMYELAYLYHMAGFGEKCVEECNQLILYFGDGKYVIKALELKAMHEPLSEEQDYLYRRLTGPVEPDIVYENTDMSKYNQVDLEKDLANSLKEVLFNDQEATKQPVYEEVQPVYEEPVSEPVYVAAPENVVEEPANEVTFETTVIGNVAEPVEEADVDNYATKVIDTAAVNAAVENAVTEDTTEIKFERMRLEPLINNPNFKGRVIEPVKSNTWDMHEISLGDANSEAIKFPNYDDMVSLEGDGQISMNIPEQEMVEKQITGQISIEDILAEWERMKKESDQKWQADVRKRVLDQTTDMLKIFDETSKSGLLEELEDSVNSGGKVELTIEEQRSLLAEENAEALNITIDDVEDAEEALAAGDATEEIFIDDTTGEIIELTEAEEEAEPTPQELFFDRTPYLEKEAKEEIEDEDNEAETESAGTEDVLAGAGNYLEAFAAASDAREKAEKAFFDNLVSEEVLNVSNPEPEMVEELVADEELSDEEEAEESVAETEEHSEEEPSESAEATSEEAETEDNTEEAAEVRVEPVEETTEAIEETKEESSAESEESFEEEIEDGFTQIQRDRFEDFIQTETGREQILKAIQTVSIEAAKGNIIIGSEDTDSAIELGKALITECAEKGLVTGKVAKIKASTLNAKDPVATISPLDNGALIIQDANELRPETVAGILKVITEPDKKMLIVFTATHRQKHKFLMSNSDLIEYFTVNIDIEALDDDELVAYAKEYAYAREYGIDEMGLLALHRKIDERQTNSHSVTVSEVKSIIEEAIDRASKKNVGHFFDVLVGKRYDDNDMVVLKEKDFE